MRIIAGEFRGRKLLPPLGQQTRPITDRVKQSLFDILAPRIETAVVYDCFAGTGSMGLECLSRGAGRCVFFERDRSAVTRLNRNIESLGVEESSQIISLDIFSYFNRDTGVSPVPRAVGSEDRRHGRDSRVIKCADLVFLDPPYRFLVEQPDKLRALSENLIDHLNDDAVVVFRHDARDRLALPRLVPYDERTYGGMTLEFLRPSND